VTDKKQITDDALGGRAYYLGRAELEIPLSAGLKELGLRPSIFADVGAVFGLRAPTLTNIGAFCTPVSATNGAVAKNVGPGELCEPVPPTGTAALYTRTNGFKEVFLGDTPKPRVSVGVGVNWNSPFGPFRIDIAKTLIKAEGDDTKLLTFNVGTAF